MSFFSKLLKGLGFEEDETEPKQKQPKKKKEKSKPVINASFDLEKEEVHEKQPVKEVAEENEQPIQQQVEQQPVQNTSLNLDIIKVINQIEVQNVVTKIKRGEKVIINMSALNGQDLTRSLDFLTGAVFALDKSMQKVDNSIFIIQ